MSILSSDYSKVVETSERVDWRLSEVFPAEAKLDFSKRFMPSAMFHAKDLHFLDDKQKLKLNQIFGNSYRYLFYFVEAYIIDMAMRHAQAELYGNDDNLRAMLRFADEEVKHQKMFLHFGTMFEAGFGTKCDLVENPQGVAQFILGKSPLAVTLVTLHLEIVTQSHYVDCMRDSAEIEPLFKSLFKFHWMEEAQHAKLDGLEIVKLKSTASPQMVEQCITDYFDIANAFAGLLANQAKLDVPSLERATGKKLAPDEAAAVEAAQGRSYVHAFLRSGVTNASFLEFVAEHFPTALERMGKAAEAMA